MVMLERGRSCSQRDGGVTLLLLGVHGAPGHKRVAAKARYLIHGPGHWRD